MPRSERVLMLSLGISADSKQGVAVAQYTSYHSRMWAWDAETLEVVGSQDVSAAATLLDTSPSGELCAYHELAPDRQGGSQPLENYVAISKPPYFSALWIRNSRGFGDCMRFLTDHSIAYYHDPTPTPMEGKRDVLKRTEPKCPITFEYLTHPIDGSGRVVLDSLNSRRSAATVRYDPNGRAIQFIGQSLCADGVPFIDMRRGPFAKCAPPDWALRW